MTVLHRYTHDGTNGATVTTGNSGYAATVGTGTAATYSTSSPGLGTAHIVFASGNTNAWQLQATDAGGYSSFFVNVSASPGTTMQISRARTSGGGSLLAAIRLDTGRHLAVYDGAGTLKQTSTTVLSTNTWYQVLWNVPGDGTQTLRIYNQAGTSLLETMTPGASSASAGTCADHTIGQNTASTDSWRGDHHRVGNAALNPIQAPTAAMTVSVVNNLQVSTANTSATHTGDGETLTYDWNWGDGTSHDTTATPTHTYSSSNTYTVTLTVTDTDGQTASANQNITVTANVAPTAAFTVTNTPGTRTVTTTNTSSDSDGTIASYDWNWGDGTSHSTTATPSHTYASDGLKTVTLTVTDDDGTPSSAVQHTVQVTSYTPVMDTLGYHFNRLAGTTGLEATGAANVWAGTTGLELVGALNSKAGNTRANYKDLAGVLNQLAGTTGLEPAGAVSQIIS